MATEMDSLHDVDSERRFLSAIMEASAGDVAAARKAIDGCGIRAEHFYLPAHREVFEESRALLNNGQPVNSVSLWANLASSAILKAVGGISMVSEIESEFGASAAIPALSARLASLALRRNLFEQANKLRQEALNEKLQAADVLSGATKRLVSMTTTNTNAIRTLEDVMFDCIDQMEAAQRGTPMKRVTTGMPRLDNILGGGLPPSMLTLVGAEPGTGKSAVLASILSAAAKAGYKIGVFSLEDEAHWIGWRVWAFESDVPQPVLKFRELTPEQRRRAVDGMDMVATYGRNVFVDDRCGLTARDIAGAAADMILNHGCECIIIDHLGEVKHGGSAERYDLAVGDSLREIRDVAKRHNVPIVVASQLARRKDRKAGEIPTMQDFRNSGDIEAVARVMLGLGRVPGSDLLEIGVLKNTNGQSGVKVKCSFIGLAAMVKQCEGQDEDSYEQ